MAHNYEDNHDGMHLETELTPHEHSDGETMDAVNDTHQTVSLGGSQGQYPGLSRDGEKELSHEEGSTLVGHVPKANDGHAVGQ